MPEMIIKNRQVVPNPWQRLTADTPVDITLPAEETSIIVPLSLWQARREELLQRPVLGLCLEPDEDPSLIAADLEHFAVIAVHFPVFTDGRGFSAARLLRERYAYKGEIRAVGAFIRDQLFYLQRCGVDAFALETSDPHAALASLDDFSIAYQAAVDRPPHFRTPA